MIDWLYKSTGHSIRYANGIIKHKKRLWLGCCNYKIITLDSLKILYVLPIFQRIIMLKNLFRIYIALFISQCCIAMNQEKVVWDGFDGHSYTLKPIDEVFLKAISSGDLLTMQDALNKGANMCELNESAIIDAVFSGRLCIVQYLVEHGAGTPDCLHEAFVWVVNQSNGLTRMKIVKYLVDKANSIKMNMHDAMMVRHGMGVTLITAAQDGILDVLQHVAEHGADIHADDDEALRSAARYGHFDCVQYLVEHDANVHAKNDAALKAARESGHTAIVNYLMKHK